MVRGALRAAGQTLAKQRPVHGAPRAVNRVLCLKNSIPSAPRRGMIFVKKPLDKPYFR